MVGLFLSALMFAASGSSAVSELYNKISWLLIIIWSLYPFVWIFAPGLQSFSVSFESVAYAILDVNAKVVLSIIILTNAASLEFTSKPDTQYV